MRVIIAGSRTFTAQDYPLIEEACLASTYWYTEVISGTADGVDKLGELFAKRMGIPVRRFPADWARYGRSAGPRRNEEMAKNADALVAIWDGHSKGTAHMIAEARRRQLLVYVRRATPQPVPQRSLPRGI